MCLLSARDQRSDVLTMRSNISVAASKRCRAASRTCKALGTPGEFGPRRGQWRGTGLPRRRRHVIGSSPRTPMQTATVYPRARRSAEIVAWCRS